MSEQTLIVHGRPVVLLPAGHGTAAVYQTTCECGNAFTCIPEMFTAESRCVYCSMGIDLKAMREYFANLARSRRKPKQTPKHKSRLFEEGDVDE